MNNRNEGHALILEGGGTRGIYTSGVLDFFLKRKLEFDYIIGVSAGACNATGYISKQLYRNARVVYHYSGNDDYMSFYNLFKTGSFFGMDMMFNKIPNYYLPFDYEGFKENVGVFKVVVTNCVTGKAEYIDIHQLDSEGMNALKATISLPYITNMVQLGSNLYLDGGITDSIPIRKSIRDGNRKHVVVLTRDKEYRKKENPAFRIANRNFYREYPLLRKAIEERYIHYNRTLELLSYLEERGECFVIRPKKEIEFGRLEKKKEKLLEVYEMGYRDAMEHFRELCDYLGK